MIQATGAQSQKMPESALPRANAVRELVVAVGQMRVRGAASSAQERSATGGEAREARRRPP